MGWPGPRDGAPAALRPRLRLARNGHRAGEEGETRGLQRGGMHTAASKGRQAVGA